MNELRPRASIAMASFGMTVFYNGSGVGPYLPRDAPTFGGNSHGDLSEKPSSQKTSPPLACPNPRIGRRDGYRLGQLGMGYLAFASQGPGAAGTASMLTRTMMAILVYGVSALVVASGLIGALRRH
jgi:hypothetical protein